ncbi:hypothetical protein F4809DRAFT_656024 [Biscogniauxia mediterranea]|nr:hypothetical protein F4809DRAFT_656024 [Biscogniauxia mediterranea]
MANNSNDNAPWGSVSQGVDDSGLQVRPMGLKVHYTFDKDSQERCLARWPQILQVQTIPIDEHASIGVIDLRTCLQAVAQCSPELAGDQDKDYTIYAFDYSEPDTPLVGQGLLSWGLSQVPGSPDAQSQLVTGRVTKNLLAIFGNGIKETLEVRLKLTAISKITRNNPSSRPQSSARHTPTLSASASAATENSEWNSFIRANPGLSHAAQAPTINSPIMPEPIRPFGSSYGAGHDIAPNFQGAPAAPSSRPTSVDPLTRERHNMVLTPASSGVPLRPSPSVEEPVQIQAAAKTIKPQSRPSSRASSHVPTGRPRGRPRKTTLVAEGSTSGYEDGTDGDDQPPRKKKRAKITKVERSNTATFGSAPESLRVAASTAGSIRNFRPIAASGEAPGGSHLQEVPRAPTPIPDSRLSGLPYIRPSGGSILRRQSITSQGQDGSFASHPDLNRSLSQSQDAHSPMDSIASPFQAYSDEASPADIGSSPPVPRSAMYSVRSSPAPSSPILPPMPGPAAQPDSGFMSGGLDEGRVDDDNISRGPLQSGSQVSGAPKPKPRRSRVKKQEPKSQPDLHIHTETPGPPELLPQTSIYNPPVPLARRNSERAKTPATADNMRNMSSAAPSDLTVVEPIRPVSTVRQQEQQAEEKAPSPEEEPTQGSFTSLFEAGLLSDAGDDHQRYLESLGLGDHSFTPPDEGTPPCDVQPTIESTTSDVRIGAQNTSVEPELPAVPASDPVLPQLTLPMPLSEPAHPQTDVIDMPEEKSNKNYIKRQTIKQKLEEAITHGQMPSFCQNCGALQTPTWRKVWKQVHKGVPEYHEYSEKPGHVTAIKIIDRDDDGKPTTYEIIKKSLGPADNKSAWTEVLLCNPCGIWFSKWKAHRPADKWEKDERRLTQTRKKRANGTGPSRSKKSRTKNDGQPNLTSEACPPTDPVGQLDGSLSPREPTLHTSNPGQQADNVSEKGSGRGRKRTTTEERDRGSTHSRGTGTPGSPIMLDEELGTTRRLLFPSPRKDGEQRVLGEVAVNIVQTSELSGSKENEYEAEKENRGPTLQGQSMVNNDFTDLFGTPPRPSTPPPKGASSGPFKTPTRPTPSHRPITRSVTKSKRSGRSTNSPNHLDPSYTPTRTPRSALRRSPRHLLAAHILEDQGLDTPMTKSLNQLLSDAEHFVMPSPSRAFQLDMNSLSQLDSDDHLSGGAHFDFGNLLSTDNLMPSSPPVLQNGDIVLFGDNLTYDEAHSWAQFHVDHGYGADSTNKLAMRGTPEDSH